MSRKIPAGVGRVAAGGSKHSYLRLVHVNREFSNRVDDRLILVVGRKLHGRGDALVGITLQVPAFDDHVTNVIVVPEPEAVIASVERIPVL